MNQIGHTQFITSIIYSPTCPNILATASTDKSVIVWNTTNRKKMRTFFHQHPLTSLLFTNDGKFLLSGDTSGQVYMWNLNNGRKVISMNHGHRIISMVHQDDTIFTAGSDKIIHGFTLTGMQVSTTSVPQMVKALYPCGSEVLVHCETGLVCLMNHVGNITHKFYHDNSVSTVQPSPINPDLFATACLDGLVRIWSIINNSIVYDFIHESGVSALRWLPHGKTMVAGSIDGSIHYLNATTGERIDSIIDTSIEPIIGIDVDQYNNLIVVVQSETCKVYKDTTLVHELKTIEPITNCIFSKNLNLTIVEKSGIINLLNLLPYYDTLIIVHLFNDETTIVDMSIDEEHIYERFSEYCKTLDVNKTLLEANMQTQTAEIVYRQTSSSNVEIYKRTLKTIRGWLFNKTVDEYIPNGHVKIVKYNNHQK